MIESSVVLPLPEGPLSITNSPSRDLKVDAAQRLKGERARAVRLGDGP
jgi:hypothetical protein